MYSTRSALCFSGDQQWDSILRCLPAGDGQDPSPGGGALMCPAESTVALLKQERRAQGRVSEQLWCGTPTVLNLTGSGWLRVQAAFPAAEWAATPQPSARWRRKESCSRKTQQHVCVSKPPVCYTEPRLSHTRRKHTPASEAQCVPGYPWLDGKQADLTLAQENLGYWGQTAASSPSSLEAS